MRNALIRRGPFGALRDPMGLDRLVSTLFEGLNDVYADNDRAVWAPAVDVEESTDGVVVHADIPGVDPKDVKVTFTDGVLSIEGERKDTKEHTEGKAHWVERFTGTFRRSLRLPERVDGTAIKAEYANGVLSLTCPVKAEAAPREIKVKVA